MNSNKISDFNITSEAEIAMNLHYLAEAIISYINDETCTGDIFGIGEDDLVMELYPYAQLIVKLTDDAYQAGRQFSGVFVYDSIQEIAENFMGIVERQNVGQCAAVMPDIDEFELDVARVISAYTSQ